MYVFFPARFLSIAFIDGSIRDAGIERGWQLWIKRLFIRRSDLALANSRAGLKNYGVDGQVIYNAVDTGRFLQRNESNSVNIIMLASFTPYKDHNTFLKAAITLVTKGLIENVYLPGSGPTLEGYIRALSSYPEKIRRHFHFPGMIKNVEQYLAICRYGVLCSTRRYGEGVSNAILEYMASGCVAIATNVGGTSEIIREGHNGFLVNEKDAEQIVERIELLEKDTGLRNSLIANARNTIEQQFSYDKNLRLLKDTYSNILKIVK
jgi:glycosyltransferase involved in cell wall biosynthesis